MFGQGTPRSFLWLVRLCLVLIIGSLGCNSGGGSGSFFGGDYEDYDNDWVGTWELSTVDGQSWDRFLAEDGVNVTIHTNNWKFYDDGSLEVAVEFTLEPKEGVIAPVVHEAGGTYSLTDSNYTLKFKGIGTDFFKDSTGTWARVTQSTLKLTSDDGTTVRFQKK